MCGQVAGGQAAAGGAASQGRLLSLRPRIPAPPPSAHTCPQGRCGSRRPAGPRRPSSAPGLRQGQGAGGRQRGQGVGQGTRQGRAARAASAARRPQVQRVGEVAVSSRPAKGAPRAPMSLNRLKPPMGFSGWVYTKSPPRPTTPVLCALRRQGAGRPGHGMGGPRRGAQRRQASARSARCRTVSRPPARRRRPASPLAAEDGGAAGAAQRVVGDCRDGVGETAGAGGCRAVEPRRSAAHAPRPTWRARADALPVTLSPRGRGAL